MDVNNKRSWVLLPLFLLTFIFLAACTSTPLKNRVNTNYPTLPIVTKSPVLNTPSPVIFHTLTSTPISQKSLQNNTIISPTQIQIKPTLNSTSLPNKSELITFLPSLSDFPQCNRFIYTISLSSASAKCLFSSKMPNFSVSISSAQKNQSIDSLILTPDYKKIDSPQVGQGSLAGLNSNGNTMQIVFFKGNSKVSISYTDNYISKNPGKLLEIANWMDKKIPNKTSSSQKLSFPDTYQPDRLSSYFSTVNYWIFHDNRYVTTQNFYQNDRICIYIAPLKTAHYQLWTGVLYDIQKKQVIKKGLWDMSAQKICGGLEPYYAKDKYKTGDQYEIRLAVDNNWVATFPFTTK